MGPDAMILVFWMLSFKSVFSLSSLTFIKRFYSPSSLSAIRVVSSAYLRLLVEIPTILIPVCASFSQAFHKMYSTNKLNTQGDIVQPWRTTFPIWNQSIVQCPDLTVASWPAYRFLKRQVRWSGIPISFRIFQFVVIHTKALAYSMSRSRYFFWNSRAFSMIQQMLAIWSLVSLHFRNPAWTSGSSQCRRHRLNSWVRKSPGEGNDNPIYYSCLGNPLDREPGERQSMGSQKT